MDYSTPSFPVLHYLPEFVQSHAHWVGDAVQLSHPLPPSSPPAFRLTLLNQSPRRVPLPDVSVVWANRTRLRSVQKQRLSSLIRGWSGLSLPSAAHLCPTLPALPGRPWAGLLLLDLTSGVEFMWGQHGSAAPASDPGAGRRISAHGPAASLHTARPISAHGPPQPSWIATSSAVLLHMRTKLPCRVQQVCTRSSGLNYQGQGLCSWPRRSKWNYEAQRKKKKVRLYFITQSLFLFPGNC